MRVKMNGIYFNHNNDYLINENSSESLGFASFSDEMKSVVLPILQSDSSFEDGHSPLSLLVKDVQNIIFNFLPISDLKNLISTSKKLNLILLNKDCKLAKHKLEFHQKWIEALSSKNETKIKELLYDGYIPEDINDLLKEIEFEIPGKYATCLSSFVKISPYNIILFDADAQKQHDKFKIISDIDRLLYLNNINLPRLHSTSDRNIKLFQVLRENVKNDKLILFDYVKKAKKDNSWHNFEKIASELNILLQLSDLDFSVKNEQGNTPIHHAAVIEDQVILPYFIEQGLQRGFDFSIKGEKGLTALHLAAQFGHQSFVLSVLKSKNIKNEINLLSDEGASVLYYALEKSLSYNYSKSLVEAGANTLGDSKFMKIIANKFIKNFHDQSYNIQLVELLNSLIKLPELDLNLACDYNNMLLRVAGLEATKSGTIQDKENFEKLVEFTELNNFDFATPEAYIRRISEFIDKYTRPATLGNFKIEIPESPNKAGSILHLATKLNSIKALKTIVNSKSMTSETLNYINEQGLTPLYLAIEIGNLEAALVLLHGGANPFIKSSINVQTTTTTRTYNPRYGKYNSNVYTDNHVHDIKISKLLEKHIQEFSKEFSGIDKLINLNITDCKVETTTIEEMQLELKTRMENFQLILNALPCNIENPSISLFEIRALEEIRSKFNTEFLKLQSYDKK